MAGALTRRNFLSLDFGDRRSAGDHWVRVHRVAMACRFEVMLSSDDAIDVEAARAALDEADEIDATLTIFRDSDVSSCRAVSTARGSSEPCAAFSAAHHGASG